MSTQVTPEQLRHLAPNARSNYREAFQNGQPVLEHFGISNSPLRVAHFMAQVLHECGGLAIQFENLNYSAPRLPVVWPTRFKPRGPLNPSEFAHNPRKLANEVYGGRMGNTSPEDGFTFRGRGMLQLTGKVSYEDSTTLLRGKFPHVPDFTLDPDAVLSAEWSLTVAAAEWFTKGCNELADRDSIRSITKAINGGLIGLADRMEWLRRTKNVWS